MLDLRWSETCALAPGTDVLPEWSDRIGALLVWKPKIYRCYVLTQTLAHATNPALDPRCLQAKCGFEGGFDARTFAKNVVAEWEREHGNALGLASDPYVGNPARVPEISEKHIEAQGDPAGYRKVISLLDHVRSLDREGSIRFLDQILIEYRRILDRQAVVYPSPTRVRLDTLLEAVRSYLTESSKGTRLQAAVVAWALAEKAGKSFIDHVDYGVVNANDKGGKAADVDLKRHGKFILCLEVKEMPLNMGLLEDKIRSCREAGATELTFVVKASSLTSDDRVLERALRAYDSGLNVYVVNAYEWLEHHLRDLGELGRADFVRQLGSALDEMRADYTDRRAWEQVALSL